MRISRRGIIAAGTALATGAHAQVQAHTYLVFFDFERTNLTARALQLIAQAAQASTRADVNHIQVEGHSGTNEDPDKVQELSDDRAGIVAAEIIRLGIPKSVVTLRGLGNLYPLDPSNQSQNRRVEIYLTA